MKQKKKIPLATLNPMSLPFLDDARINTALWINSSKIEKGKKNSKRLWKDNISSCGPILYKADD